jgi:hypothetical protein
MTRAISIQGFVLGQKIEDIHSLIEQGMNKPAEL